MELLFALVLLLCHYSAVCQPEKYCISKYYSNDYIGTINVSSIGTPCIDWILITKYFDQDFPDLSVRKAHNYCRNPGKLDKFPHCFTNITTLSVEECDIPVCIDVKAQGTVSQSTTTGINVAEMAIKGFKNSTYILNKVCSMTLIDDYPYFNISFPSTINVIYINIKFYMLKKAAFTVIMVSSKTNQKVTCSIVNGMNPVGSTYYCNILGDNILIQNMLPDTYLSICYIEIIASFKLKKCRNSNEVQGYNGKVNVAKSNKVCTQWKLFKNLISTTNFFYNTYTYNYCQTFLDPYDAWCFVAVANNTFEKHYCKIEDCSEYNLDCQILGKSKEYLGYINKAKNGETCQFWSKLTLKYSIIARHNTEEEVVQNQNFCRNFNDDPNGVWCYTIEYKNPKMYCNIPYCVLASSFASCEPFGCDVILDNEEQCIETFLTYSNISWFVITFPYEIKAVAVRIVAKFAQYFSIETSTNNIHWFSCKKFYQISSNLKNDLLFKCSVTLKYIRLKPLNNEIGGIDICEFQVFMAQPKLYSCGSSDVKSMEYFGDISTDQFNKPCLFWENVRGQNKINLLDQNFLFNDAWKARNYCRSPILRNITWCYVMTAVGPQESECDVSASCKMAIIATRCNNFCYTITMGKFPSCSVLNVSTLQINNEYSIGIPHSLVMPFAVKDRSYVILVLSQHFPTKPNVLIENTKQWRIEYLSVDVLGEYLRLNVFPLRKIELKDWMYGYRKHNKETSGWLYLLFVVSNTLDFSTDLNCCEWITKDFIDLEEFENLGFLEISALNSYFVEL